LKQPDQAGLIWEDRRLAASRRRINNPERVLRAAERLYGYLRRYVKPRLSDAVAAREWRKIGRTLSRLLGRGTAHEDKRREQRITAYKKLIKGFKDYNEYIWFNYAVETRVLGIKVNLMRRTLPRFLCRYYARKHFDHSDWYGFQKAVREHQRCVRDLLKKPFAEMEIKGF
jgi:hypothetical protein